MFSVTLAGSGCGGSCGGRRTQRRDAGTRGLCTQPSPDTDASDPTASGFWAPHTPTEQFACHKDTRTGLGVPLCSLRVGGQNLSCWVCGGGARASGESQGHTFSWRALDLGNLSIFSRWPGRVQIRRAGRGGGPLYSRGPDPCSESLRVAVPARFLL